MTEMMKAAIFVEPGKMAVEEVPKAMLEQDDDIVIRVVRTCVCGSDLWFFRGLSGQAAHSQVGHEAIGVVEELCLCEADKCEVEHYGCFSQWRKSGTGISTRSRTQRSVYI